MSLNKAMIIGNLGHDPEVRSAGGTAVANFSVATTEAYKDRNGERKIETTWLSITAFGKTAEFIENYIKKGRRVYVEGRLRNRKYTTNDGEERSVTEILAEKVDALDKPNDDSQPVQQQKGRGKSQPVEAYDDDNGENDLPF